MAGGSEATWRSLWRTTPACKEAWKAISAPVPTISSVEPPPMSTTRVGSRGRVLAGGADVGEPRLLLAVEHPRREREALAQLGDEGVAVGGVAHGAGRDRDDLLDACLSTDLHVVGDRLAGRLDRLGGELPREVDAAPEPGHPALPLDLDDAPARHVGDQQPRRVGADVDHRDPVGVPCHAGGTLERPARKAPAQPPDPHAAPPHVASMANRRGVEQPGSSSGS